MRQNGRHACADIFAFNQCRMPNENASHIADGVSLASWQCAEIYAYITKAQRIIPLWLLILLM
jgi:hypothetical protein